MFILPEQKDAAITARRRHKVAMMGRSQEKMDSDLDDDTTEDDAGNNPERQVGCVI